jgi:hypothetical protein
VLYLPGCGSLRIAGQNGVTTTDLGGVALDWHDYSVPEGHVHKILASVLDGAAHPFAGNWEDQRARLRRVLQEDGVTLLGERQDTEYGGQPWMVFELQGPPDAATGAAGAHYFAIYGESGLNGLLLHLYCTAPAEEGALATLLDTVLGGIDALSKYLPAA